MAGSGEVESVGTDSCWPRRSSLTARADRIISEWPEGVRRLEVNVTTYEATVENGQIRLPEAVRLPEHAKVYVVVPGVPKSAPFRLASPRLARPELAVDFAKDVTEEPGDASV